MSTFGLNQLKQIAITVDDVERATAFYRDVLGIRFLFSAPGLAFFDVGGVRLMLTKPERPEFDHPASLLYYGVEDIQAAAGALESRGAVFEEAPRVVHRAETYDLWIGALRDSEGNLVAIMSEVPKS